MRVGILSESDYDTVVLTEIINKLGGARNQPPTMEFLNPYEVGTTITAKMAVASAIFFNSKQNAEVVIFGVDLDGKRERRNQVNRFIRAEIEKDAARVIVPLFIEPHLEELFFAEGGNALKVTLTGLTASDPIPFPEIEPKSRLRRLIREFGPKDLALTAKDIYGLIAKELDIDQLARNHPDFRRFKDRIVPKFRSN